MLTGIGALKHLKASSQAPIFIGIDAVDPFALEFAAGSVVKFSRSVLYFFGEDLDVGQKFIVYVQSAKLVAGLEILVRWLLVR